MQVNDLVVWIGHHISDMIVGQNRARFLSDLKHNRDHVVKVFSHDIDQFAMTYTMQTGQPCQLDADEGDGSPAITYAKAVAAYMHDELLKDELIRIS